MLAALGRPRTSAQRLFVKFHAWHVLELPLKPGPGLPYAAVWDIARARLLVTSATSSGGVDFWLVMLGPGDQP